jgi:hypothetical protein
LFATTNLAGYRLYQADNRCCHSVPRFIGGIKYRAALMRAGVSLGRTQLKALGRCDIHGMISTGGHWTEHW